MAHKLVYLLRHGATPGNLEKRYIGQRTDEDLLPESIQEAKELAEGLRRELEDRCRKAPRLLSGPLKRTRATAAALAEAWREGAGRETPDISVIDALTEIDFGDFEGKSWRELQGDPRYQEWIDSGGSAPFPGGEDRSAFTERSFAGFLEALGDPDREEGILIVCHGGSIMAILSLLTGGDYYAFMTEPLKGYRLELEMEDEGITAFTYRRFGCGDPAGLDHR